MGEVVRFPEDTKVIMGEVEKLPDPKRPRQSRKRNVGQDPLAPLIRIRESPRMMLMLDIPSGMREIARFRAMLETMRVRREYRMKTIDEIIQTLESDYELGIADAIRILKFLNDLEDIEVGHSLADSILCKMLKDRGFDDVIAAYASVEKWYA